MKLAIMQPKFFPYLGHFQLVACADKYVFLDDVNFQRDSWFHRNKILINGEMQYFGVKLNKASQNKKLNEIELVNDGKWRDKLMATIRLSYKNAPYFQDIFPIVENIILDPNITLLSEVAERSVRDVSDYLAIQTDFLRASQDDSNQHLKSQDRIMAICNGLGANEYYNLPGGRKLYAVEDFQANNIDLYFIEPHNITYPQFDNLQGNQWYSIVDILMFNAKEEVQRLLQEYSVVN